MVGLAFALLWLFPVNGEILESIQEGIRLLDYNGYSSVSLIGFEVDHKAIFSTWLFKGYAKPLDCPVRNVTVYIQHGGYPLITPKNEDFPAHYYTKRQDIYGQTFSTIGQLAAFRMLNPRPGAWYGAAFLTDEDTDIRQKGFGASCTYYASVSHVAHTLDDVPELSIDARSPDPILYPLSMNRTDDKHLVRYRLPRGVWRYDIRVTRCVVSDVDFTDLGCPIRLLTSGGQLPSEHSTSTNCSQFTTELCHHQEIRPEPAAWNYLGLFVSKPEDFNLILNFTFKSCQTISLTPPPPLRRLSVRSTGTVLYYNDTIINTLNKTAVPAQTSSADDAVCVLHPMMDQSRIYFDYFTYTFLMSSPNPDSLRLQLSDSIAVLPLQIREASVDGGGTLKVVAQIGALQDISQNVSVTWCMSSSTIPVNGSELVCHPQLILSVNTSEGLGRDQLYIPYPETGTWYVAAKRRCYVLDMENNTRFVECVNNHTSAGLQVSSSACASGKCGDNGQCRTYYSGVYFFTSCSCYAGWRGYTCGDASAALPESQQIGQVLLLTLSNLMFLPAAVIAMHRRYWTQGIVYLFTMTFSGIYHACDRSSKYSYCLLSYDVLSYCDFYGSILSACVTLIAMSKVNEPLRGVAMLGSCLFLAFGVAYDKHSLWVFGVPVIILLIMVFAAWGCFCRSRRTCYPPKLRYLTNVLPGAICALLGVLLFGLVETQANYPYVHSAWHALMALAVICVLPPRSKDTKDSQESLLIGLSPQPKASDAEGVRLFAADEPTGVSTNEAI